MKAFVLILVALFAVAAVIAFFSRNRSPLSAQPAATPSIAVADSGLKTVPHVADTQLQDIKSELSTLFKDLYTRAFTRSTTGVVTPSPTGPVDPLEPINGFFALDASAALHAAPAVFVPDRGLHVTDGRITYSGLVTLDASRPVGALLDVDFQATEVPDTKAEPRVHLRQAGTLRLNRTAAGWVVGDFDVHLESEPIPTPSPSSS